MKFAARLEGLEPYLFATLSRKMEEKRRLGIDVINLGSGDPDTPTCPGVVAAAHAALDRAENHRYPTNRGTNEFRLAAAGYMQRRFGVTLDPDTQFIPTLGGKEAVHHLGFITLGPGDICLYPDPAYPVYRSAACLAGADTYAMPLRPERRFFPDLEAIPPEIVSRARLLYLNYPNNPTGATAELSDFAKVVEFAREHDIIVVHDNAYSELSFDGFEAPSFLQVPGSEEVGVEIYSLSKGWNMTGWRIGFIAGNARVVERLMHLKPNIDAGPFGVVQAALVAALGAEADFPRAMSRVYEERRDVMVSALRNLGLELDAPRASLFLWARNPPGWTSKALADAIFEEAAVVVSSGDAFGPSGEGYIRIALTSPTERLREAATRLAALSLDPTAHRSEGVSRSRPETSN
jgi:LL-diaminopimelate aminotransferase